VRQTKRAIERGFQCQEEKRGLSLIEVLSPCPTYWRMSPVESMKFIDKEMVKTFPLGKVKDWE
jgi:2-oxoglutarate ferredoxin oxidoreductase subunit beta